MLENSSEFSQEIELAITSELQWIVKAVILNIIQYPSFFIF